MKKIIFSIAVMVSAFFAASCQQEMLETQAGGNTVTYTVEVPGVATKAIADGKTKEEATIISQTVNSRPAKLPEKKKKTDA